MTAPRLARSLVTLRSQVNELWPNRPKGSDGWIGDTAHSARTSDHNPNASGVVHAVDLTEWVVDGIEMNDVLAELLRAGRDPRIKYVISDGRMFSSYATSSCKPWMWRKYSGVNAHTKHVHVSVLAGIGDRSAAWALFPPQEDELASAADDIKQEIHTALDSVRDQLIAHFDGKLADLDAQVKILRRDTRELGKAAGLKTSGATDGVVGN